jgi:hypothetical protein
VNRTSSVASTCREYPSRDVDARHDAVLRMAAELDTREVERSRYGGMIDTGCKVSPTPVGSDVRPGPVADLP